METQRDNQRGGAQDNLKALVAQARDQDAAGNTEGAAATCKRILASQPDHRFALSLLANLALRAGRLEDAVELCERALEAAPGDPVLHLNLGMTRIRAGDEDGALKALRRCTELKPDLAMAHLYAGALLHRQGRGDAAVCAFNDAFNADPSLRDAYLREDVNPEIRQISSLANGTLRDAHRDRHLAAVAPFRAQMDQAARKRLDGFLGHFHGLQQLPWQDSLQRPTYMLYPGLPARPWYEREEFDWIPDFEGAADTIREECVAVLRDDSELKPYLDHIPSAPPQMRDLMGSSQWSSYHLLAQGREVEDHCRACPRTLEALRQLPMPVGEDQSPEAFFSILRPDTHIPPHFGVSNTKIVVHLALVIPSDCGLRAGTETRTWRAGECLIFDDSFEHEAWNRSDESRAVLITEVWNPALSEPECKALEAVLAATAEWHRYLAAEG